MIRTRIGPGLMIELQANLTRKGARTFLTTKETKNTKEIRALNFRVIRVFRGSTSFPPPQSNLAISVAAGIAVRYTGVRGQWWSPFHRC